MRSHRRWLPVLSIMALAMVLSAATMLQIPRNGGARLVPLFPGLYNVIATQGLGLLFSVGAIGALCVTRRWHQVAVTPRAALGAIARISFAYPALFWSGFFVVYLIVWLLEIARARFDLALPFLIYGSIVLTSALGARAVAAAGARLTGRVDRPLRRVMVVWAALWPFVHPIAYRFRCDGVIGWPFFDLFSAGSVLAWQLPIGLASAAWFLRRTGGPPAR